MEPKIIEHRAFLVAGTLYEGKNENQEIASMWENAFDPNVDKIHWVRDNRYYGVCEMDPTLPEGAFRYVAAVEIASSEDAPAEFYQMRVPGGRYAVFEHVGSLEGLRDTYERINHQWLPNSGYQRANRPDLEVYTERFKGFAPDSVLELWIPVE